MTEVNATLLRKVQDPHYAAMLQAHRELVAAAEELRQRLRELQSQIGVSDLKRECRLAMSSVRQQELEIERYLTNDDYVFGEEGADERIENAPTVDELAVQLQCSEQDAEKLIKAGITSAKELAGLNPIRVEMRSGLGSTKAAEKLIKAAKEYCK